MISPSCANTKKDMETLNFVVLCFMTFVLAFQNGFVISLATGADTNLQTVSQCSESDYSVDEAAFQSNLKMLLDSLASNVVDSRGFYQESVGEKGSRVYGSILCRGDMSGSNCSNCTLDSIRAASHDCPKSRDVSICFRWCFLRYSNDTFFGDMQQTAAAITNDTDFDDPSVVSQGLPFMRRLAALAPEEPFMFRTAELDVSDRGMRYGMAQCTRDISRLDCRTCLDAQLVNFRTAIGNKRRWEVYGSNCFMWYSDYQFYSNVSTLLSAARRAASCKSYITAVTVAAVSVAYLVVL